MSDWKKVASTIADYAPMLSSLIPIPGAGIAGQLIASALGTKNNPKAIMKAIEIDPQAALKIAETESNNKTKLEEQMILAETMRIQTVNQTMRGEQKSEHWMQWSWRPFVGFIFGITFFGCYFILPLSNIEVPAIPTEAWMMIGAVLGVASWHRGSAKVETAKK